MTGNKVLIVEDDLNLLSTLEYNLSKEGYPVITAVDGAGAVETARRDRPDLIILDVMLPGMNGFEVCRMLRKDMMVPILMLTAKVEETDKIIGLEIGADDYITKPFSMRELLARVRAALRRVKMTEPETTDEKTLLKVFDLEIDLARHRVDLRGKTLELTPKEFGLLSFLARNRGLVFSRAQLLDRVWGYDYAGYTRTVDVHVRWLRKKIETDPGHPKRLLTVRGTGYKLEG